MAIWKLITITCILFISAEAKIDESNEENDDFSSSICDPAFLSTSPVQCFCTKDGRDIVQSAECYPTNENVKQDDTTWSKFRYFKNAIKLSLTNTRGVSLNFIPKNALKYTQNLIKLDVKYGNIKVIEPFAFANLTLLEEIRLSGNQIEKLKFNAFAHHSMLKEIGLDTNNIVEINRDVFIDLPELEKLFITNNKVAIIHDKAFIHLSNLRELEIDRNKLFSLNSETFAGLSNLQKLDLSCNSLEVIGDNTFKPLPRLIYLNLDDNKIQMLDSKAFHGLKRLQSLALGHNELTGIENVNVFQDLNSLTSLSLKANRIVELRQAVIAPIINNFYQSTASFDIEDNNFPCDCRLEWLVELMNKTESASLKLLLENFKCLPDSKLQERWMKRVELEKNSQTFEGDEQPTQNQDYEYYDDTELNGKLFYTDVRDLLNCSSLPTSKVNSFHVDKGTNNKATSNNSTTLDAKEKDTTVIEESVFKKNKTKKSLEPVKANGSEVANQEIKNNNTGVYTTSKLATVSAKPLEQNTLDPQDMASDEAKSDSVIAHRSIQEKNADYLDLFSNGQGYIRGCFEAVVIAVLLNITFLLN